MSVQWRDVPHHCRFNRTPRAGNPHITLALVLIVTSLWNNALFVFGDVAVLLFYLAENSFENFFDILHKKQVFDGSNICLTVALIDTNSVEQQNTPPPHTRLGGVWGVSETMAARFPMQLAQKEILLRKALHTIVTNCTSQRDY